MKLIIKRILLRQDVTIGCLQVHFSGRYTSRQVPAAKLRTSAWGKPWLLLGETLEHQAIPWRDDPQMGLYRPRPIPREVAIPEGAYRVDLRFSRLYGCTLPMLLGVPGFKNIVLKAGRSPFRYRGDIVVGHLVRVKNGHPTDNPRMRQDRHPLALLQALIAEAIEHGEVVVAEVRSPREWKTPFLTYYELHKKQQ